MTSVQKITLSASRDIPFNKLLLSQSNVRRVKAGVAIEELAEDIARHTLLTSVTVRPVLDADGAETGMFEIPAGGRRYRALELLVKQKRLARTAPVPCVVRTDGLAEEDSLAENIQRAPLHPLDQFRAFQAMFEKGMGEEEIAAAFFVSAGIVKQRLRLAAVSPKLLEVYAEDSITLDQLMAFTVNPDHERQEQVWEALQRSYTRQPYEVRRMLTEGAVRASDKRAQFVGIAAYVEAGGVVMRDLFQPDDGGWLQDAGLLDLMVEERLREEADAIRGEGWKWVETATDFAYGHTYGLRRLIGEQVPLTDEEQATRDALQAELEQLDATWSHAEEVSEEADQRFSELETAIAALDERPIRFEAEEQAIAGTFVSIDGSGTLRIERGYVRPEDEAPIESIDDAGVQTGEDTADAGPVDGPSTDTDDGDGDAPVEPEEDDGIKPLPDRLLTELTAYRTLALRHAIGGDPDTAFLIALHALCLKLFYHYALDTCLEIDIKVVVFGSQAPGLGDTPLAEAVDGRHRTWAEALPKGAGDLWDALAAFDRDRRMALFAHCVSFGVNAVHEAYNRRPRALGHADRVAQTIDLDLVATGWMPTAANYLGRVTKARIVQAIREAKGDRDADALAGLKKGEMTEKAESLLAGSGWLPEPLRTPGKATLVHPAEAPAPGGDAEIGVESEIDASPSTEEPDEPAEADDGPADTVHAIAAE